MGDTERKYPHTVQTFRRRIPVPTRREPGGTAADDHANERAAPARRSGNGPLVGVSAACRTDSSGC